MFEVPQNLDTILHIGAGKCEELSVYLRSNAKRILLVEPNPRLAAQLRQRTEGESRVQVMELAVSDNPGLNQLNEYNLPEASSLYQPTGLKSWFPGLRIIAQHSVATRAPQELVDQEIVEGERNLLVVQAPGAEFAIVKALANAKTPDHLSLIWLTNPRDIYYENASRADDTLAALKRQGYEIRKENNTNPDWPQWQLTCNPLARKIKSLEAEIQAQADALQQSKKENTELKNQLTKAQEAKTAVQKELQVTNAKLSEAEKRAEQLSVKVKRLEEQLAIERGGTKQFNELKQRMEYLFGQQSLQMEQAANALGRHVSATAKTTASELEAGFQLQQQYGPELASLEERGNRLPSTVALQISRQLKSRPYDLIIEMGSGVTTSFLVRTLRKESQKSPDEEADGKSVSRYIDPSEDDLPKRIVCFEHNRANFQALQENLKQSGLSPIINLHYAPLVQYQHQGTEYLYYDCAARLQQIANLFENREARIFILLNDTAGETQPDQYAALPQLLQYLSVHSLDLVINSVLPQTKLVDQWHALLESRGLDYQPATGFGNPVAQLIKINPS